MFYQFLRICTACSLALLLLSCNPRLTSSYSLSKAVPVNASVQADSSFTTLISPYKEKLDNQMQQVIGYAARELLDKRGEECTLGNFVADLMREEAQQLTGQPVHLGLINSGSLRVSLNAGPITRGNIFELMPFENELVVLKLDGAAMQQLFDYIGTYKKTSVSGMVLRYKDGKLVQATINGAPFDPAKTYTLAAYDYVANGGDNMHFLAKLKQEPVNITLRNVIIQHIEKLQKNNQKADASIEGRLVYQ